jgi:hypothetical protein
MSEHHTDCERFETLLLERGPDADVRAWHDHLASCAGCLEQWATHQMLVATFAEEATPELSPAFEAGLQRKLDAAIRVRPLRGWRVAALAAYALGAVALMRWILVRFPLPQDALDPGSPWIAALVMIAVPFSLWLTAAATRLLPAIGPRGRPPSSPMAML